MKDEKVAMRLSAYELLIITAALEAWTVSEGAVQDEECRKALIRWLKMGDDVLRARVNERILAER